MPEKLFLIDAMAMIYRAYFAMISNPLINSKGKNTSAIYGFVNSLVKILEDEKPHHIAVCIDTQKETFRHKEYPEYKAQRQEIPSDMPWQIGKIKEVIKAFNIPLLQLDGYEADDIIGTLVKQAEKENVISYMVTPDKDFMQLVTDKIFLYKPSRNLYGNKVSEVELIDIEGVKKKFGVTPSQVIEVLGLMGDTSDNIPGIKGVGEKTAISLIQQFGTIDNMYKNIDQITKPKLKENIASNRENAFMSQRLVTIKTDVPLDIDFHTLIKKDADLNSLLALFEELEFKTLVKRFSKGEPKKNTDKQSGQEVKQESLPGTEDIKPSIKGAKITDKDSQYKNIQVNIPEPEKVIKTVKDVKHNYKVVSNDEEFLEFVKLLSKQSLVSFHTETDTKVCMNCNLAGMTFSFKENEAWYIPVFGKFGSRKDKEEQSLFDSHIKLSNKSVQGVELNFAIEKIKPVLESKSIKFIGQNLKYDYVVMKNYGIEMTNLFFDTLIGAHVLQPDGAHDLSSLSEKYLSYRTIPLSDLTGKGKDQITIDKVDVNKTAVYSGEKADVVLQLYFRIKYELGKLNLLKLCNDLEFRLIKVLSEMEFEGFKVDEKILSIINTETEKLIAEFEEKIYKSAGEKFNINSTQQLADILFKKLNLTPVRKTKTGFSTDVKVLEELKYQHEIASLLTDYRVLTKLKSTYLEGLKKSVNPKTKRVHTVFNQVASATGRLSSNEPNLQNIPIRTEVGRSLRKAFIPRNSSYAIMSADYSQIELRIMAHYADDANMISAFKRNHDIHTETSMRIFNLHSKNDVTPGMRRKAKEVNFGIIYGIGAFGLASRLEIKNSEARDIIERYFTEYPKVKDYMERTKKFAREFGYVETLLGRRRYLKQINNQNATARAEDERAAINMPIQGTAADMIKLAMVNIYNEFMKHNLESKMLLQVHDELVFEVKKNEIEKVKKIVIDKMKNAIELNVPIEVEVGTGESWYEAH